MTESMEFRGSSYLGGAGGQVPFQRSVEPSSLGTFVNLEMRDMNRLKKYEEAWRMYLGQHWSFAREDGEPLFTDNVVRKIIDQNVTWLVGEGFTMTVPEFFVDAVLPHLEETWDEINNRMTVLLETAQMGGVTGDVFLLVVPHEPDATARYSNPYTKTFVRIHLLDSGCVFPIWDPLNTEKLLAVKIVTLYVDANDLGDAPAATGPHNIKRFIQIIHPHKIIEYIQGEPPKERINPLGEIPLVHIKNMGLAKEYYGLSDADCGLIQLQREMNEKATDISDTLNYHAHPITVIVGAKVKNLERGPKKIWSGFPAGTEVFNLEMSSDLGAATDFLDRIREMMRESGEESKMPEGGISNTSGVALEMQFLPTFQRLKRKKPYYEKGLQEVNYFILRWKQTLEGLELPYGFCKNCGGKIVDTIMFDRKTRMPLTRRDGTYRTKPKCYQASLETGLFVDPEEMKLRVVRKLSKGSKREVVERWKLVAEMKSGRRSFWDPWAEGEETGEILSAEDREARDEEDREEFQDQTQTVEAKPMIEPPKRDEFGLEIEKPQPPPKEFEVDLTLLDIPPEPESIVLLEPMRDENGRLMKDEYGRVLAEPMAYFVVPTECSRPVKWNPLKIECKLNSALPRDEHLESQLAIQQTTAGFWSREHAMKRQGITNPRANMETIRDEEEEFGPVAPPEETPRTALQGDESGRAAANGGDPNKPRPKALPSPFGKNQAKE